MRHVRSAVELRCRRDEVELRDVADEQHVEEAIVRRGIRRELHPAAVEASVRDDDVVHAPAPLGAVEPNADAGVAPGQELARQGVEERRLAAERLRHRVGALRNRAAHPETRDIREVPFSVVECHAAEVELARSSCARNMDSLVEARRKSVRPREILAGPLREHRELDAATGGSVHHLIYRAVTADDDEEIGVRLAREVGELARPGRHSRLSGEPEVPRAPLELGPALARGAVRRRGIDEEDRAAQCQYSPAVTVASATFVIRSTAARSSSSLIRVKTPSTTMSLTVSRQPACTPRIAPTVNSAAASISTASTPRFDQRSYCPSSGLAQRS